MTARFVILHHVLCHGEHWDLMLEIDGKLATWRLPRLLSGPADLPMTAPRITDHRLEYLTYEGPVSGDRGRVTRVDGGSFERRLADEAHWEVTIHGQHGDLHLSMIRYANDEWCIDQAGRRQE